MVTTVPTGAVVPTDGDERRPRRTREERKKRVANRRPKSAVNTLIFNPFFILLFVLLVVSCMISFFLVFSHPEGAWGKSAVERPKQKIPPKEKQMGSDNARHRLSDAQQKDAIKNGYEAAMDRMKQGKKKEDEKQQKEMKDLGETLKKLGGKLKTDSDTDGASDNLTRRGVGRKPDPKGGDGHGGPIFGGTYPERFTGFDPELNTIYDNITPFDGTLETPHLLPKTPKLPVFAETENGEKLVDDLLHNNKPTMAGIIYFFNEYLKKLHVQNKALSEKEHRTKTGESINEKGMVNAYYNLTSKIIDPLEDAYRGRTIFPVRDDGSIFISLAAFREHLLAQSMMSAFDQAKNPDKLFIGAVVQNCFGLDGLTCKTGIQVVGTLSNGQPKTSVSPAPPDSNGIEVFCTHEDYKHYCENGQVRVLYIHDTDALGPQTARYYASKLWGGENYFMQMDSHLEFAPEWDDYYISEMKASSNYPKSILSSYPPGFKEYDGHYKGGTRGERLCGSHFAKDHVENEILRIEQLGLTPWDAEFPTQIPFIAAGFFFAHSSFLRDVPFDPYAPWCFMGEEIALSIRAWTHGWNIYAPRKNLIAHQYRPGRMGLPKFWESVGRDSNRGSLNTRLQKHVIRRVKHMLSYPSDSREKIEEENDGICLHNYEHYTLGHDRVLEDYLQWTSINPITRTTGTMEWCLKSQVP